MSERRRWNEHPRLRVSNAALVVPAGYDFTAPTTFTGDEPDPLVWVHHRGMAHCGFLGDEVMVSFGAKNLDTVELRGTPRVLRRMLATAVALLDEAAEALGEGTDQ